ncbi:MobA/MobL family protein [Aureimonas ureilytica]|uniref:MobA/MobL family protein n=1 Tax=Aureimonas ureilytica TaxID=401562 RepID=UPI000734983E|nr:MobA/MobL family protein [Aureimonas ureilytica]
MTSLPAHEALLCTRFGVVQRSRGKSSVAAAAYRAGTRLTDARTGATWDYGRKKGVLTSYVTAPPGAPAWVHDRSELWSRVELAERRRDAQTARETQVSIPRDLPYDRWRAFLDDVAAPYVAAGAIVDTAIHVPMASDNEVQPHAHLLVTLRALDPGTETGFAASRNAAVAAFFTSGGRNGEGKRADAMTAERARIADVTNAHLRAAGSVRRADPRSYAARGAPREPEPKLGEQRVAAIRRCRKHDRRSAAVTRMRATQKLDNEITKLEMEMALKARGFARAPARQTKVPHQQDYKLSILRDRFPDGDFSAFRASLYLVDAKDPRRTRVLTREGAWVEADDESGTVTTWGPRSASAAALAEAISASTGYGIDTLRRTAAAGKPGKSRRKSAMREAEAITLADRWRHRGFSDVVESPAGVCVGLGGRSRLLDSGDHVDLVGPVSDQALRALAAKASEDWGSSLELDGLWPAETQARLWLECQRQGVVLAGYVPPPAAAAAWAAESGSVADTATKLRAVRSETREADLLLSAAAGDVAALRRLDPALRAFVTSHLDDDQRADLLKADREEVVSALNEFRGYGADCIARDPEAAAVPLAHEPDPAPGDEYERRPA